MIIAGSWWWVVWAVLSLALFGAWFLLGQARAGARLAWGWIADWLQGRVDPPWWWKPWLYRRAENYEEEPSEPKWGAAEFDLPPPQRGRERRRPGDLCPGCEDDEHCDGDDVMCNCTCGWPEDWAERPEPPRESAEVRHWRRLERARAAADAVAEAEHRAAYESLGFDYPSGLMARVRELAP